MPRAKRGNKRLERRKKILKLAKGYRGTKSKLYRSAKESVERGLNFAYTGRKLKKRDFRSLWIVRIGAAARLNGLNYSQLMHGLKLAGIGSRSQSSCRSRRSSARVVCTGRVPGQERARKRTAQ